MCELRLFVRYFNHLQKYPKYIKKLKFVIAKFYKCKPLFKSQNLQIYR